MQCQMLMSRTHTYVAAFVVALAGTAAADPKSPQCWDCLQRLAVGFPAVNAQEDPSYEQGLTPGSVLPGLAQCSLDDGEIPTFARSRTTVRSWSMGRGRTWTQRCATWWITVADCCCNRTSMRAPAWTGFCT